ncbi:MAG TPA: YceI family protein [Bacteroidota bacterium]|nr:YceI family protein [Bacteroidota bacterium]
MKFAVAVMSALVLVSSAALGQGTAWRMDPAHSKVEFGVKHMVISEVTGIFKEFDATLSSSKPDFTDAVFSANIKTASVSTDNTMRDNHLRSDDFLNAEKYPAITFKSTRVEKTGDDSYKVYGDLTIRDVTKPVILDTKLNGVIKDPMGNQRAGFTATTSINRFDYGVKWNRAIETGGLIAGDKVTITLNMEFVAPKGS